MEKITDKIAALPDDAIYSSLEFFPPKNTMVSLPRPFVRTEADAVIFRQGLVELAGTA